MNLDDRLKKLATGISVTDAIDAYLAECVDRGDEIQDLDRARQEELLAIVEIMFLMAAVDGEISEEEIQQLHASIEALADMRAAKLNLGEVFDTLNAKLGNEGWKRRLEDATSRLHTPDAKPFAFRLAAGVAFADDFVAHAEAAAIDALANALELGRDDSQTILREVHETLFGG